MKKSHLGYLLALVIVVFLLVFWFSLQPQADARDFLPEETSFYFEWTEQQYWQKSELWPIYNVGLSADLQLSQVEQILGSDYSQLDQIVWFRLALNEQDHYLLKFNQNLNKKKIAEINNLAEDYKIYPIQHDIYLLTTSPQLAEGLPGQISGKFLLADDLSGINLYFDLAQPPTWLSGFSSLLQNYFMQGGIFINFDLDSQQIVAYQKKSDQEYSVNWNSWLVPNDFDAVLASSKSLPQQFIKQQLLPSMLKEFPSYYFDKFSDQLQNSLLIINNEDWLLASMRDWQSLLGEYTLNFGVKEEAALLPDKTRYSKLVRKDDFVVETKEFVGQQYWQVGNFYGLDIGERHYLSNSEQYLQEVIVGQRYSQDLWAGCLLPDTQVSDLFYLQRHQAEKLGLSNIFKDKINHLGFYAYQDEQIDGLKLCY